MVNQAIWKINCHYFLSQLPNDVSEISYNSGTTRVDDEVELKIKRDLPGS